METQAEILAQLTKYLEKFPDERQGLQVFIDFVTENEGPQLIDRKNFTGHITASAFIINAEVDALLLLKHKSLNRWLQPGGHVDADDRCLMAAALRETQEETGILAQNLTPVFTTVFDFDSHRIPENVRKNEASHYHHDVRFLFAAKGVDAITIAEEESTDSKWISFDELKNDVDFGQVIIKIEQAFNEMHTNGSLSELLH